MSDATDQYWLGRWVDEYEVTAPDQLRRLFALPGPMARLAELAKTAPNWNTSNPPVPGLSVAAGRGIDLSGYMSCSAYGCMRKAVDAAYAGIFHYFDYIVVEGASPRRVLQRLNTAPQNRRAELYY